MNKKLMKFRKNIFKPIEKLRKQTKEQTQLNKIKNLKINKNKNQQNKLKT